MWSVTYTKRGEASFAEIDAEAQRRIDKKLQWLADNFDAIDPQPLSGPLAGSYKLRVGDYRVIYEFDRATHTIWVLLVGHRSTIYDR